MNLSRNIFDIVCNTNTVAGSRRETTEIALISHFLEKAQHNSGKNYMFVSIFLQNFFIKI